jgi:hypothetical protein
MSQFTDELTTLVVIYTNSIGNCQSNYHVIKTTTVPKVIERNKKYQAEMKNLIILFLLTKFLCDVFLLLLLSRQSGHLQTDYLMALSKR